MKKIESFALKYNKTIAFFNVILTFLIGIVSLVVSCNALKVSKNQEEMLKLQMQYLYAENLPHFSVGEIDEDENFYIYNVTENGAVLSDASLLPSTVMTVRYKNKIIGKIDLKFYLNDVCSFDYESNSFKVHKYKNVISVEKIWDDIRQQVLEMLKENDVVDMEDFDYEYDEIFLFLITIIVMKKYIAHI